MWRKGPNLMLPAEWTMVWSLWRVAASYEIKHTYSIDWRHFPEKNENTFPHKMYSVFTAALLAMFPSDTQTSITWWISQLYYIHPTCQYALGDTQEGFERGCLGAMKRRKEGERDGILFQVIKTLKKQKTNKNPKYQTVSTQVNGKLHSRQQPEDRGQRPANTHLLLDRGRGVDKTQQQLPRVGNGKKWMPFFTGDANSRSFHWGAGKQLILSL